ncbi:MAG: F0F1 ATP synthase subunit A [Dehalococcoidia bacterium]|nr:F0F1 ATP synthase subunit A [Dehalococcoidia bacterium]
MKLVIAIVVIALMAVGFLFVKGPSPAIVVAPEHIFNLGPIEVTNTMFTSWWVVGILCLIAVFAGPRMSVVPSGFSGVVEGALSAFYGIVVQVAGEQNARRFFWVVSTIFFYVLMSNYFGLLPMNNVIGKPEAGHGEKQVIFQTTSIAGLDLAYIKVNPDECEVGDPEGCPTAAEHSAALGARSSASVSAQPGGAPAVTAASEEAGAKEGEFSGLLSPWFRSVNTDVNAPLAIAIFSFIFVEFWGLSALGFGYLKKFFNFGRLLHGNPMGVIDVFVGVLELVSELSRMVSFTFRLFGNVFAGEVLLAMMTFLVPFVLVNVFYGLELFVGLIQAFVFAMLTLVFAQTAVTSHDSHEGEHGEAHH